MKLKEAFIQLKYFLLDYCAIANSKKLRMIYIWLNRQTIGIFLYRLERMFFLIFGKSYSIIRILFLPIYLPLYAYSNCEINYKADIGPGINIFHPSLGVVISGKSIIGKNLTLVGGNVIGMKDTNKTGFTLGDNITLGANALILGPIKLGNNINIGAQALVNKNFEDNAVLIGNPAKNIREIN